MNNNYLNIRIVRLDYNNIIKGSPIDKDNYDNY